MPERDEHWRNGKYHPMDLDVAKEQIFLAHEDMLIEALNRYFGHDKWNLNDVGGQAREYFPIGPDGPKVIRFRDEDILQIDPPLLRRLLIGKRGMMHYRIRYEFLGRAKRVTEAA